MTQNDSARCERHARAESQRDGALASSFPRVFACECKGIPQYSLSRSVRLRSHGWYYIRISRFFQE